MSAFDLAALYPQGPADLPAPKPPWPVMLLQLALGGALGGGVVLLVLWSNEGGGVLQLFALVVATMLLGWAQTVWHEAGHALAGWAAGMKPLAFGVGPLRVERRGDGWALRWGSSVAGIAGFALFLPRADSAFNRRTQAIYLLGGPLANLLTVVVILGLLWAVPVEGLLRAVLLLAAGLGAIFGALNLLPFRSGGWLSDGAGLRLLWRQPAVAASAFRMQQAVQASMQGQRPREWPQQLLPTPDAPFTLDDDLGLGLGLTMLRLQRALDVVDHREADAAAAALAAAWPSASAPQRPGIAMIMAGYVAVRADDLGLLKAWQAVMRSGVLDDSAYRAWFAAEVAWREGDAVQFANQLAAAQAALPRIPDAGSRVMVAERLAVLATMPLVGVKDA